MLIIRKIGIKTTNYLTGNTLGKLSSVRCIVNIKQPKKRLVLFTILFNIIKTSYRENFINLSISKLNATLTQSVFSFSLSLSKTGLSFNKTGLSFRSRNLRFNQTALLPQILFHFIRNILISDQLINFRQGFRIKTTFNLHISFINSTLELFVNFINIELNLLALFLNKIPIEFKLL